MHLMFFFISDIRFLYFINYANALKCKVVAKTFLSDVSSSVNVEFVLLSLIYL